MMGADLRIVVTAVDNRFQGGRWMHSALTQKCRMQDAG